MEPLGSYLHGLFWKSYSDAHFAMWLGFGGAFLLGYVLWVNCTQPKPLSRRSVVWIGIAWTLFCTLFNWVLGPYSSTGHSDERTDGIAWIYYVARLQDSGLFAHSWAGGVDAVSGFVTGTTYLSLERLVFSILPMGLAVWVLK
ncbi:hypothetical protein K2X33_06605, partial [bacterium]|nr:hypothetical protein [bacterium]